MKFKRMIKILNIMVILLSLLTSCPQYNEKNKQISNLGEVGKISILKRMNTAYYYSITLQIDGVLNATRYYLYYNEKNNPETAIIYKDNSTNELSCSFERTAYYGKSIFLWYRASDGTNLTDFSNSVSLYFN